MSIEQKVNDVVNDNSYVLTVGKNKYNVAPPTLRMLSEVSAVISKMPKRKQDVDAEVWETLACAEYVVPIQAEIVAVMILGAKKTYRVLGFRVPEFMYYRKKQKLINEIIDNYAPKTLLKLFQRLMLRMDVQDFFGLTTSLIEISLLKATKEVG